MSLSGTPSVPPWPPLRHLVWLSAIIAARPLLAATGTNLTNEPSDLPALRPPLGELPPGLWEAHGPAIAFGVILSLILIGFAVWLLVRPRPSATLPAAVRARRALEPLSGLPESGALLSDLSRILRRYLAETFALPPEELTTTEFCERLRHTPPVGSQLAGAAESFLRQCDLRKFSPRPPDTAMNAAAEALRLVDLGEARVAEIATAQTAPSPPKPPTS